MKCLALTAVILVWSNDTCTGTDFEFNFQSHGIYILLSLGIDGAVTNLASAVGFITGGILLEVLYTDFIQVDTKG